MLNILFSRQILAKPGADPQLCSSTSRVGARQLGNSNISLIYRPLCLHRGDQAGVVNPLSNWPLHNIVITSIAWCMAYKREVEGGSYLAQKSCNTIATVWASQVGGAAK